MTPEEAKDKIMLIIHQNTGIWYDLDEEILAIIKESNRAFTIKCVKEALEGFQKEKK